MIYVVSGSPRTGTSMMMAALHRGTGLDVLVAPEIGKGDIELDGYLVNPNGLYEVGRMKYFDTAFLREIANDNDCLIKIFYDGLPNLYPSDYTIIFMERSAEEINHSVARVEKHKLDLAVKYNKVCENEDRLENEAYFSQFIPFCPFTRRNQEDIEHVISICEARNDMNLIRVNYKDVIEDPLREFEKIKYTHLGEERVPVDVKKAASVIDPKLYRVRSEDR